MAARFNLILMLVLFTGCSTLAKFSDPSYMLELKGQKGEIRRSSIQINRENFFYENNELSHKSLRELGIKLQSRVTQVEDDGSIWVQNRTYEKKGNDYLHSLGYPELDEHIDLRLDSNGRVSKVTGFNRNSIFYVPPVLLPKGRVRLSDSWDETFYWSAPGQPLTLKTTIHCQLVGIEDWEEKQVFRIKMKALSSFKNKIKGVNFQSNSAGYFLWDNDNAMVIYSESKAEDELRYLVENHYSKTLTKFVSKALH